VSKSEMKSVVANVKNEGRVRKNIKDVQKCGVQKKFEYLSY
jgi:hypothetical protein